MQPILLSIIYVTSFFNISFTPLPAPTSIVFHHEIFAIDFFNLFYVVKTLPLKLCHLSFAIKMLLLKFRHFSHC